MPRRLQHPQTLLVDSEHHRTSAPADSPPAGPIETSFQQPCPACGRQLLIVVEHLGKQVSCGHCRRSFVASDVSQDRGDVVDVGGSMLKRAEQLLALLESSRGSRRMYNV